MHDVPLRGTLRHGERLRNVPLVRLNLSRTPPQPVLDRLEHDGLVTALPNGGVVARIDRPNDVHEHGGEAER